MTDAAIHAPHSSVVMALDRCKGCGLCVPVCRPGVLEMTETRNPKGYVLPRLLDGCTGCRACAEVCPDFVFEVYRFGTTLAEESNPAGQP